MAMVKIQIQQCIINYEKQKINLKKHQDAEVVSLLILWKFPSPLPEQVTTLWNLMLYFPGWAQRQGHNLDASGI